MANRKISELGALTAPAADDLLAVVDVSEGTNSNKNKKITYGELFKSVIDGTETAPAFAFDTAATTGLYKSAANELSIATNGGRAIQVEANNKVTIYGDLVVTGGTTTVSSSTITVADKNIELATGNSSDAGATGGGLTIKAATDKTWNWIDSTDSWTSNQNIDLVSGMSYKIQANQVLTATTLGAGVVNSSLTSVGTLGSLAVTGEIDAGSLDVSGDADIDGTMEAVAYTVNGTALNVFIQDTVGAMVSSNTETNIAVSYDSTNNNLDFEIVSYPAASISGTTLASNVVTSSLTSVGTLGSLNVTNAVNANSLTLTGGANVDGTMEADAYTVNGTALNVFIQDTVGAMVSSNTETNIAVTYDDVNNNLDFVIGTLNQDTTGNAATATALQTARTIGGVSFNGTANINLPGVNQTGNQNTTGSAATLTTARTIGGVSFDGSANINLPGVNAAGNQNTSGTAAVATTITIADESTDTSCNVLYATGPTGNLAPKSGTNLTFNSASGLLTATSFAGALTGNVTGDLTGDVTGDLTGNADTATALETARTIGGVSFNGTSNINLPGVNAAGNQSTSGNAATATALATARTIGGTSFDGTANITPANATNAVNLSGTLASGVTGTTQSTSDNSTKIATTAYVTSAVANLIDSAPGALDTLNELAAAIGDDANFSTTITNSLATKLPLAGGTMTGAINLGSNNITNGGTISGTFVGNITGNVTGNTSGSSGSCTGNAATATALATARTIGGVSFDGSANINLPGVNAVGNQNTTGSAATLTTARTIGGVSFNGSANINLPGVNAAGNQNTSGNAATATALATARAINGVNFDGTAAITVAAAAGTLTGNTLASGVTASSLTSVGTLTGLTISGDILMTGTGVIDIPAGTTGQRPGSPTTGMFRYNTTDAQFEGFTATGWGAIAGGGGAANFTYLALRNANNSGNAVFDGTQDEFTLVSSGTNTAISPSAANVLLVSLGGVIQQPNEGTSTSGITGFCIDGSVIKFGADLTMAPDFIIHQVGAGVGTPSDNTVDLAHLAHKTQGDILFYGASGTPSLLNAGTSGKFLRTNGSSANPTWETVDLANLSASNLTSGTVPDARFPSTLPAVSGANLTALNGSNISSGTIAAARVATLNQNTTGSAATLTTSRNIGGVSFNGSANIDLPGVNSAGNQNTSGNAATATALATARTIGGTSFDGTANITPANATNAVNVTGTVASAVTGTTQSAGNNSTKIATTAYADTAVSNLVDSAPGTLNTLNELAAALGDDANFSTTITNSIATKLPLAGGTLTGALTINAGSSTQLTVKGTEADVWLTSTGSGSNKSWRILGSTGGSTHLFRIHDGVVGSDRFTINSSGNATFAGSVTATGGFSGSGSSLSNVNATTLDSIDSGSFLRSDQNDTTTGQINFARNHDYKFLLSGTNDPFFKFQEGSSDKAFIQWNSSGFLQIQNEEDGSGIRIKDDILFTRDNWSSSERIWNGSNDGAGSGLDADLLDGVQGSSYLRSDTSDSCSGDITFNGGAAAVEIGTNSDIRFNNGTWTGDSCKIQHHSNMLYIQGGSSGHIFRRSNGTDAWHISSSGHLMPSSNNSVDLGSSSNRIKDLYTMDLNLSNEGSGGNMIDNTWGDFTIQEGEEDLFLINNRSGKAYKFNLTEVANPNSVE